jgi:hypothetical protein
MAVKAAPMAAPAFSWTGFYIGGNVGVGRSSTTFTDEATAGPDIFGATGRHDTFVGRRPGWLQLVIQSQLGGRYRSCRERRQV